MSTSSGAPRAPEADAAPIDASPSGIAGEVAAVADALVTDPNAPAAPAILVMGTGIEHRKIVEDVLGILGGVCPVVPVADLGEALAWLHGKSDEDRRQVAIEAATGSPPDAEPKDPARDRRVTLVVQLRGVDKPSTVLRAICEEPGSEDARLLYITEAEDHPDLAWVVDSDRLDAVLTIPWQTRTLERILRAHAFRHLAASAAAPDTAVWERIKPSAVESQLLANLTLSTQEATLALLSHIEEVLGPRPRLHLPPGVRIIHENDEVNAVLLVLDGRVAMSMHSSAGDVLLHHASTGPVVGLLSLADQERAFVTARTTTAAEVVHLTVEQLDRALREKPEIGAALTAVSIRVLSARLRRAQNLHVEKYELAVELEQERARLAEALDALERARTQMIAQARFATLGELSAGIAHELNNPIAAVTRSIDHLADDVQRLLKTHPHGHFVAAAIDRAQRSGHASTKDERRWRREVTDVVGDRELARRLVAIGVRDAESAREFVAEQPRGGLLGLRGGLVGRAGPGGRRATPPLTPEERLELAEIAAGIGTSLRNLDLAGHQVQDLVGSLKTHARPDAKEAAAVDVVESLTNATLVTGHRLHEVEVEWSLDPDLPPVAGQPGALGQVWANLLTNAVDATAGVAEPRIEIDAHLGPSDEERRGSVVVAITDNGAGISEENLERIFQPQFTTKQGTVRYGLGMGLGISRTLLEDHGGSLEVTSRPGATTFTATLPRYPEPRTTETTGPTGPTVPTDAPPENPTPMKGRTP